MFSMPIGPHLGISEVELKFAIHNHTFYWLKKHDYLLRMEGVYHPIVVFREIKRVDPDWRKWFSLGFSEEELNELVRISDLTDPTLDPLVETPQGTLF